MEKKIKPFTRRNRLPTIESFLDIRIIYEKTRYFKKATENEYAIRRYSPKSHAYIFDGFATKDELIKELNAKLALKNLLEITIGNVVNGPNKGVQNDRQ